MATATKPVIFVFTTAYYPFVSGAEIAIQEICQRLSGEFKFFIITWKFRRSLPRREERPEGTVIRVGFGGEIGKIVLPIAGTFRTLALMREARPTLFWPVMVTFVSVAPYLLNILRFWDRVPVVLTLQEGESEAHIGRARFGLIGLAWRLALARTSHLTTISAYLGDLARRYGWRGPAEIIPNGVDVARFARKYSEEEKAVLCREFHIGSRERVVITTSRLAVKNGIDVLIRAIGLLNADPQKPGTHLLILGEGEERQSLERLVRDLQLERKVRFLGTVPYADVPRHLAVADVFCRPSRSEGLGNSFLEAMASGVPVVATPVGGILDFLHDGENGLACRVDDPADCAAKIRSLFGDQALRARIIDAAKSTVAARYQWEGIAGAFRSLFTRLESSKPLRILIATGIFPSDIGGPATYSVLLRDELLRRGHRVSVVTYGPAGISRRIPKGLRHAAYFALCLRHALGYDLIYAQDPVSAGLPAMLAAALARRRFAIRVAGDYAWEQSRQRFGVEDSIDDFQHRRYGWRTELLRAIERAVVNRADIVVAPSEYFRNLVSRWVREPRKVHRVYNGIVLDAFSCRGEERRELSTLLTVGRFVPWKGFTELLEVLPRLPGWRLVIVGDGPERKSLELRVKSLKLEDRVVLTGRLDLVTLSRWLCRATVFVLNTSFESFSFDTVQAMAAGVPVVVTDIGNLREIVTDGEEGVLVKPNDMEGIARAVRSISQGPVLRGRLVANARRKAGEFSLERTTEELLHLLGEFRS